MDIKDPVVHTASGVEAIRCFQRAFFLWVSSELTTWRDKVIGSRGQTVDLSPHGCAVICCAVGSGLAHRRRAPPHRDNDYFHRGAMFWERWNTVWEQQHERIWRAEWRNLSPAFVCRDLFLFFPLIYFRRMCFCVLSQCLVWLLRKGSVSTPQRWREGGGRRVIRKTAISTKWLS